MGPRKDPRAEAATGERVLRVVVADGQRLVAEAVGLSLARADGIVVVGRALSVEESLRLVGAHRLDVAVVDVDLPSAGGFSALRAVARRHPSTRVVMLAAKPQLDDVREAVDGGCAGFVAKSQRLEELVSAVRDAAAGVRPDAPALRARLGPHLRRRRDGRSARLSPRELEVLQLVAEGRGYADVAATSCLALNTVRNHMQSVLRKLEVHSRMEAVALAVQEGAIRFP